MEQNKTREYTLKQRILTLFAIAIGIALAYIGKSLLTVVLSSVATVFVVEQIISFLAKK